MPTVPLPDSVLIEALNLAEQHGSAWLAVKAGCTIPRNTLDLRIRTAKIRGLKPTFNKEAPRIYTRQRIGRMHLVIPDTQVKPGVCTDHMEWIGNYIVEKKPDVIVHLGDHWDMPSLSSYSKGKLEMEGRRYVDDCVAGQKAMERLLKPLQDYNRTATEKYQPEMHFLMGNHEYRIHRAVQDNPHLKDKLKLEDTGAWNYGWKVHPFLEVLTIDGIQYSHYFTSGSKGLPVSSAAVLLRERQTSATMGHVQYCDIAIHKKTQKIAMFAGTCYLHDEDYLGPQGNTCKRHIIIKHEVEDGKYDPMFASLRYLEKAYS